MKDKKFNEPNLVREVIKTPCGDFILEATSRGLYRLRFPSAKLLRRSRSSIRSTLGDRYAIRNSYLSPKVRPLRPTNLSNRVLQPFASKQSQKQKEILSRSRKLLLKYLQGKPVSFASIAIDFDGFTAFERKVLNTLKKVEWGSSLSYSALAAKARFPRASRTVGSTMKKNRLPIFLPCHRVVTSGGKLGGYSAGLQWKKKLLDLEGSLSTIAA